MAFYDTISLEYGPEARAAMKKFCNLNRKFALARSRKWYLEKCNSDNLFPKYLNKRNTECPESLKSERLFANEGWGRLDSFNKKLLNHGIESTNKCYDELRSEMESLVTWLDAHLPEDVCTDFFTRQKIYGDKLYNTKMEVLTAKFNGLVKRRDKKKRSTVYRDRDLAYKERNPQTSSRTRFKEPSDADLTTQYVHLLSKSLPHPSRQSSTT